MRTIVFCLLILQISFASAERPLSAKPELSWQLRQRADLEYLASEELRGRGVQDESIDLAAEFIANRFTEIGLNTALFDGQPFQTLEVPIGARAGAVEENFVRLQIDSPNITNLDITESLNSGMNPLAIGSSKGKASGELAFVGYGITAPNLNYDDYANLNVRGKVVIVLRKEPGANDPESCFDGVNSTDHAFFQTKIKNAIRHGAVAVLLVNDPDSIAKNVLAAEDQLQRESARVEQLKQQLADLPKGAVNLHEHLLKRIEQATAIREGRLHERRISERGVLAVGEAGGSTVTVAIERDDDSKQTQDSKRTQDSKQTKSIPVISIARDTVDRLLTQTMNMTVAEIEAKIDDKIGDNYPPQSSLLDGVHVDISVELKAANSRTSNVIAELPGRGLLANETIVLGAHYDHVGMGGYASLAPGTVAVHNGADDNASGTVAMMAAAKLVTEQLREVESHRRVVFIAFTAEERGLLGSKHYVRYPRFSLESTIAMINLDMVGRLRDNELTVYGTGSGSDLESMVDQTNERYRFQLNKVATGYGPSDHQSFYEAGIPVLFFFTGLHNDYHRPSDDFSKIDYGGLTRITDMVCDVACQLAMQSERPTYAETEKRVTIRRQLTVFMGVQLIEQDDHVVIAAVSPDGPAEEAGLRAGDRFDRLGKQVMKTQTDLMDALRRYNPGDDVKVRVTRQTERIEATVRLEAK
ncbi:Aminopeptidase YwaD precursor [Novipirellula aureliae]|uniref:Aminopeptidase YwaD n=1 Tax=Novipirellula aureliae TaxID=2527966 RepID=A0A5C6ED39_9BACT|nr:M28 family peptidase [Novipirellula aureliae]TWU45129.1 Aminopeptidase YwaD precursor [Novipirellula aureliae]